MSVLRNLVQSVQKVQRQTNVLEERLPTTVYSKNTQVEDIEPIIIQLRKAVSLRGKKDVSFQDGSKTKVPAEQASKALHRYDMLKRAEDKQRLAERFSASYNSFQHVLSKSIYSNYQQFDETNASLDRYYYDDVAGTSVYKNMPPKLVTTFVTQTSHKEVRGLLDGSDLYYWDGFEQIHDTVKTGLKLRNVRSHLFIYKGPTTGKIYVVAEGDRNKQLDAKSTEQIQRLFSQHADLVFESCVPSQKNKR